MKKLIAALALTAATIATTTPTPAEARASYCYINHGYNFATAECERGNYGDVYRVDIRCKKTTWWGATYYVTASGNNARVGYVNYSHAQCPNGYKRSSGGYLYT